MRVSLAVLFGKPQPISHPDKQKAQEIKDPDHLRKGTSKELLMRLPPPGVIGTLPTSGARGKRAHSQPWRRPVLRYKCVSLQIEEDRQHQLP